MGFVLVSFLARLGLGVPLNVYLFMTTLLYFGKLLPSITSFCFYGEWVGFEQILRAKARLGIKNSKLKFLK